MSQAMSEERLDKFRQKLIRRGEQLRKGLVHEHEESAAVSESQDYEVSRLEELERDVELQLDDRHTFELREVEAALQRIETGQYGVCQDCGQTIGMERLEAFPIARRCVDCKERFEQQSTAVP